MIKIPPYLKKGDTIGITCPAGFMAKEKAANCIATLQQWGLEVMVGKTVGSSSTNYFSGTDEERLHELQAMFDDKSIKAVLCGRGGYGLGRIIDQLDFTQFKKNPKWVIGYSDVTVLHNHIFANYKIASLHAPMAAAFNEGGASNPYIQLIHKALFGKRKNITCNSHVNNTSGEASAIVVGGNLSLLVNTIGTKSEVNTKNKILFIEDIGEYIYGVDRMMYQLKRSGKLDGLKGLIIGEFTEMKDTERPFGKSLVEAIHEIVQAYTYPICFDFPISHSNENVAIKHGVEYHLKVTKKRVQLKEISTTI
jgi:muramoyltetrapeptide carboxypeptidase